MFTSNHTYAYNTIYDTNAVIYHGNGPSKVINCEYKNVIIVCIHLHGHFFISIAKNTR